MNLNSYDPLLGDEPSTVTEGEFLTMIDGVGEKDVPIIFLDIDGPMIPGTQLLVDIESFSKRLFPATTIAVINELCKRSGAKVVINSTHNRPTAEAPNIQAALIIGGLMAYHLHPDDAQTLYPEIPRDLAISEWLARHPETKRWQAIDDCACAPDKHMVLVNGSVGVGLDELNVVLERWELPPIIILM